MTDVFGLVPSVYLAYVANAASVVLAIMGLCAILAPLIPQPAAGSRWILPRKVLDSLAGNYLNARNLINPGSPAATITLADVLGTVIATHEEAKPQRAQIAAKVDQINAQVSQVADTVGASKP